MFWLKQVLIALVSFMGSLATTCVSLNYKPSVSRPFLIDSHPIELNYYPFMISIIRCNGSCNTLDNSSV